MVRLDATSKAAKSCPYCLAEILPMAKKCRYCGSEVRKSAPSKKKLSLVVLFLNVIFAALVATALYTLWGIFEVSNAAQELGPLESFIKVYGIVGFIAQLGFAAIIKALATIIYLLENKS